VRTDGEMLTRDGESQIRGGSVVKAKRCARQIPGLAPARSIRIAPVDIRSARRGPRGSSRRRFGCEARNRERSMNLALGEMVSKLLLEKCRRGFEPAQMAGLHEHD